MGSEEKIITPEQYQEAVEIIKLFNMQLTEKHGVKLKKNRLISQFEGITKNTVVKNSNIPSGLYHFLERNQDFFGITPKTKFKDLNIVSEKEMLRLRLCGKKTMNSYKELCHVIGIKILP